MARQIARSLPSDPANTCLTGSLRFPNLAASGYPPHFVNRADIRMIQRSSGAPQRDVFGIVDNAHASAAQLGGDAILRNSLTNERLDVRHATS